jgi:1,2-diacylglycerol-3-alpha-glucose alpha-1,2-galactosyltransferase
MPFKINIIAEKFIGEANGVYTGFVETVEALKKVPELELTVNGNCAQADAIHSHTIGEEYVRKSFLFKKKLIVSAHVVPDSFIGSLIFSELWRPLAKWYLKFVYSRASLVIAVSPVVKTELEKIGVKTKIAVLCNAVNRQKFKPDAAARAEYRKKHNIAENAFVVLCAGQIQPRKGVADFLEAAKNLPNITFVWVGGRPYGKLTADFNHMTELMNTAPKNVVFTGAVSFEVMPAYYAMADVYLMPSLQENFAYATIEASSAKLPLVLRDNPEYPSSLFTHYLKGKNASEFTQLIKTLHENPDELKKWQIESDTLASKYEIGAYTQQLVSLYKSVNA